MREREGGAMRVLDNVLRDPLMTGAAACRWKCVDM
jgi:hypothetical protein